MICKFCTLERLLNGIAQTKQILAAKIGETSTENQEELSKHAEKVAKSATSKLLLSLPKIIILCWLCPK